MNDCWRLVEVDHIYASDARWWKYHIADIARDFEGTCWTQSIGWDKDGPDQWGIRCLEGNTQADGLSTESGKVHCGSNSGYAAIGLAYHLGFERIILLGYDMQKTFGKRHWFGDHPEGMNAESGYPAFINRFRTIDPARYGLEIWNVTRQTALDCFPRYDLDELCAALL